VAPVVFVLLENASIGDPVPGHRLREWEKGPQPELAGAETRTPRPAGRRPLVAPAQRNRVPGHDIGRAVLDLVLAVDVLDVRQAPGVAALEQQRAGSHGERETAAGRKTEVDGLALELVSGRVLAVDLGRTEVLLAADVERDLGTAEHVRRE